MDSDSVPTVSMDTPDTHKHTLSHDIGDQPVLKRNSSKVPVTLHIRYKTNTFPVECDLYDTLKDLKEKIDKLTDVDPQVQKLVNKSITSVKRDDATTTLKDLNITDGQTLLLVGATRTDILSTTGATVQTAGSKDATDTQASTGTKKEPLCKQTKHEKVLKTGTIGTRGRRETPLRNSFFFYVAGKPDNVQVGIRNKHDPLPQSIDGLLMSMLNHSAKKARLTFKLEFDELWINTGTKNVRFFLFCQPFL